MTVHAPYVSLAAGGAHPVWAELFVDTPYVDMFKQDFPKPFDSCFVVILASSKINLAKCDRLGVLNSCINTERVVLHCLAMQCNRHVYHVTIPGAHARSSL